MKCFACGHQGSRLAPFLLMNQNFTSPMTDGDVVMKSLECHEIFACPKCGTLKIGIHNAQNYLNFQSVMDFIDEPTESNRVIAREALWKFFDLHDKV